MNRKYVNIELEEQTLNDCDIIAANEKRKRKQIIEMLVEKIVENKRKSGNYTLGD